MNKTQLYSIRSLYPLALAEGEGVGTAYEYFVKRLKLARWLKPKRQLRRILVAGLPEKYGASLDFMLLASELGATLTIADDRQAALDKAAASLSEAQKGGCLGNLQPKYSLISDMGSLSVLDGHFDLAISSETLQRLTAEERAPYIRHLVQKAPLIAIFAPNDENPAHTSQSGLSGLSLTELQLIVGQGLNVMQDAPTRPSVLTGYIDLPPFPPGITRTEEQRQQASSGKGEALAMWGLGFYAHLEALMPISWCRKHAHIVFTLINLSQR